MAGCEPGGHNMWLVVNQEVTHEAGCEPGGHT